MNGERLERFRRGDSETLAELYRLHVAAVERAIKRALAHSGHRSSANTSDLVQEAFMKAFSPSARASYDGTRVFAPFLLRIAHNVAIDWMRRRSREDSVAGADPEQLTAQDHASVRDAFDPSLLAIASNYVQRLSPALKAVHHSRFVLDTPQRQAAEVLGMSRQSLRTLERKLVLGLAAEIGRAETR